MFDGCPHHGHRSAAHTRLCDAVRAARSWTRSYDTDGRVDALLALVVHAHEIDPRGEGPALDALAVSIEGACKALSAQPDAATPSGPRVVQAAAAAPEAPAQAAPEPPTGTSPAPLPLVAYTDGSGTQAHLPCGAGVVVFDGDEAILEASRHLGRGTNNHAELSAVRVALAITDAPGLRERELVVRSDSMYTIGSLTADEGPADGRPNAKLISLVRAALEGRSVRFEHVKGHSGVAGNERADRLAGLARLRTAATSAEARSA